MHRREAEASGRYDRLLTMARQPHDEGQHVSRDKSQDHSNQGGGYDGGDPDAEIKRLAAEKEAAERQAQQDRERLRRQGGGQ